MTDSIMNYPPEMSSLIVRCGSVAAAEKASGCPNGVFALIRRGRRPYTPLMETRVRAALAGEPLTKESKKMPRHELEIPAGCPPLVAEILRAKGSKQKTRQVLTCGEKLLNGVISGAVPMPPNWEVKIKAELGQQVIPLLETAAPPLAAPNGAMPPFVPWDGKSKGTVEIAAWGKAKGRKIKNVPQPIVDLVAKYGKVSAAAAAMGMTGGALMNWMDLQRPFDHPKQQKVHAAMHGMPAGGANELGQTFDKFSLNLAIALLKAPAYDRVNEIAEILSGRLVFRKNTGAGWIIIYRMSGAEDLVKFKKLAMRDCAEIVCP